VELSDTQALGFSSGDEANITRYALLSNKKPRDQWIFVLIWFGWVGGVTWLLLLLYVSKE
jgi:hypothetical protein